ncbi:prepilin peptidase, partial [bacterium (Candidatus Gribaldobacteria) CG_4_10_14_0_2_um_filter_33_15]
KVIYLAILIVFIYRLFGTSKPFLNPLFSGFGAAAFFFLLWFISRGRWMGFGDVKLGFLMGFFLSFPNILVALFFAFIIGAIIGIGLIIAGKKTLKSQVPFGPFLILGTFIALFWGDKIINWYLRLAV